MGTHLKLEDKKQKGIRFVMTRSNRETGSGNGRRVRVWLACLMMQSSWAAAGGPEGGGPDTSFQDVSLPAEVRAARVVGQMTRAEKAGLVGGFRSFFIRPMDRFGLRALYLTDATSGLVIRSGLLEVERSIAYPSATTLAATWNPELAHAFGAAIGAECRAWGADILLGPGINLYRNAQCGRNFEYFGEDPYLTGMMATSHITGVQSQGIMATGKHFICNNHEWLRHECDIRVEARAVRELYGRPWYRMIHEGHVGAVMTAYNLVNGEKASESRALITDLLREEMGFNGLVMSDWNAVKDLSKAMRSGLDLVMPTAEFPEGESEDGVCEADLDRMCLSILTTCFRFGLYDRAARDPSYAHDYPAYEEIARRTAREGITLLRNANDLLPLRPEVTKRLAVLGTVARETPHSAGGSSHVKGYDRTHILDELTNRYGVDRVDYTDYADPELLRRADAAIVCVTTGDRESHDRPFALSAEQEALIEQTCSLQPDTVVVILSGGGIRMTKWEESVGAILHAYYPGQYGARAIVDILSGEVNPSGKLPFTIEREFSDSPAWGYKPEGSGYQQKRETEVDRALPAFPEVAYPEGVFIGYRWYDRKGLAVRYPFGHGLSYTTFLYSGVRVTTTTDKVILELTLENTGKVAGAEVVQIYQSSPDKRLIRPVRELCAFRKVFLHPGKPREIRFEIPLQDLTYYDPDEGCWKLEEGRHVLHAGASSRDLRLQADCFLPGRDFEFPTTSPQR